MRAKTPDASMLPIKPLQEFQGKPTVTKDLNEKINLKMRYSI